MAEGTEELKRILQNFFTDGMVLVVGSGLSCAEGIPGMQALTNALLTDVPKSIDTTDSSWNKIKDDLAENTLEEALLKTPPSPSLLSTIEDITYKQIFEHEKTIIEEMIQKGRRLKLQSLLPYIVVPSQGLPIITTNYDRLIELAVEANGLMVDTMFCGHSFAKFDPEKSRTLLRTDISRNPRKARFRHLEHANVCKPHGSLDWYLDSFSSEPIRSPYPLDISRLMVTPGAHKYKTGYDKPFDAHRECANNFINKASRFLIIGYGFNDDHLETHLSHKIKNNAPTLIITYELSANAQKLIENKDNVIAITSDGNQNPGAIVSYQGKKHHILFDIWDIETFSEEVFNHGK